MIPEKPYAISCDRNSEPILEVLKDYISDRQSLFEVGAGTGQHAVFMAPHFLNLNWTLADLEDRHAGIQQWLKDFPRSNVKGPVEYSIGDTKQSFSKFDTVFTANTIHIVSWNTCLQLFDDLATLPENGLFITYGAFNYGGEFTSESNERFNKWLLEKHPGGGGIKDFEKVSSELNERGFVLLNDHEMPANNRMLVFQKTRLQ